MIFDGKDLKRIRKEKRMTLKEMEAKTKEYDPKGKGISESTLNRLETGIRDNPRLETVCLLLKALGLRNLNQFINWEYFKSTKEG